MLRVLITGLLVLTGAAAELSSLPQSSKVPAGILELLWWLPLDTETVQVTQTPAKPRGPLFEGMKFARGEFAVGDVSWSETINRHLKNARIAATIEGSRRFAPPSGLGSTRYEGAQIVRFERPLGETGRRLMADLAKEALKVDRFDGLEIVEFRDKLESDTWSFYITVPDADLLVMATNRAYLEDLLRRRKTSTGARALPEDLPEWQRVDVTAPFWAVRHYRRDAPDDPTLPLARDSMIDAVDPAAIGVTAHVNSDGRTIVAHYLSRSPTAEQVARRIWDHAGDGVSPAFRRLDATAIEVRFVAKDEEALGMFFFYLMAALGHAVYL